MTDTAQFQRAFQTSVAEVRQRFIDRAAQQVQDLDDLMDRIETRPDDRAALEAATHLVHKIAGVATTLGFEHMGELANRAESMLIACAQPSGEATRAQALAAVETLTEELDRL